MSKPVIVSLASALVGGLVLTAAGAAPVQPHQSEAAQDILAHADQVRNPEVAFRVSDQLVEYDHGVAKSAMFLHVYSKIEPKTEQFRNLV